jgi:cyanophycinase
LKALELAGGLSAPVRIIPTAASPDNNHERAGQNGVRWFKALGATDVEAPRLIDKASANSQAIAKTLRTAKLIYLLGGFTHYLGQTLKDSLCWQAAFEAYEDGAVLAGSSAGAMVMCRYYYDPGRDEIFQGLDLIPNTLVLPHHNTFGKNWAARLSTLLPGVTLLGIDEGTGMLSGSAAAEWTILGAGSVTLYRDGKPESHPQGSSLML